MRKFLIAGAAAIALAGVSGVAQAQTPWAQTSWAQTPWAQTPWAQAPHKHVMTVQLPNGAVEQIQYYGDVPPQVILVPSAPMAFPMEARLPFAMMQRIQAEMDRDMAQMMEVMGPLMAQPFPSPLQVAQMPAGSGVCMQSVQVTYTGHGRPKVVSRTSGDCGPLSQPNTAQPNTPVMVPAERPAHSSGTIEVKADQPAAYRTLVRPVDFKG